MQKHQIGIVAGIAGLVIVAIIYGIFAFSGKDTKSDTKESKQISSTKLPSVPKTKTTAFESKLNEAKSDLDEQKRSERETTQKIDLDVFSADKTEETIPTVTNSGKTTPNLNNKKESIPTVTNKAQTASTQKKSASTVTTQPIQKLEIPTEEPKAKETIDPDLLFASRSSRSETQAPVITSKTNTPEVFELHAVVHDKVVAAQGTRITLRTTKDFIYNGKKIPTNTFLTATTKFDNFRVVLIIPPVPFGDGTFLSEKLTAYDGNDLVKGLYAQELLQNKAGTNAAGEIVDDLGQEVPTRAARSVVRNLGRGKVRELTVTLRNNHPVIIKK